MSTAYRDESSGADRRIGFVLLPRLGAVITASIVAGLVFAMMEMVLVALVMGQPWYGPLHMIAAIGMGPQGVLPPPPAFDFGVAAIAMLIHMLVSVFLGLVLATALRRGVERGRRLVLRRSQARSRDDQGPGCALEGR